MNFDSTEQDKSGAHLLTFSIPIVPWRKYRVGRSSVSTWRVKRRGRRWMTWRRSAALTRASRRRKVVAGIIVVEGGDVNISGHIGKMRRRSCVVRPRENRKFTVDLIWERGVEIRGGVSFCGDLRGGGLGIGGKWRFLGREMEGKFGLGRGIGVAAEEDKWRVSCIVFVYMLAVVGGGVFSRGGGGGEVEEDKVEEECACVI
ncbi:hypothetical protein ACJIZ3_021721 [Penstemon smallii]|uniref:Uncharacterized protein n=1 Tax=Penstemon smallii TaxID=265156 RepID=A0ABD3SM83_9LAMI